VQVSGTTQQVSLRRDTPGDINDFGFGHDKMRAAGRICARGTPLVSFSHVIDPHFVTFSSSLHPAIRNHNPNPNPNPNPNRNPTVITDPQIGRRDPQIVTVQIRPAPLRILSRDL